MFIAPILPKLMILLDCQNPPTNVNVYDYDGCKVKVGGNKKTITLDLKDEKCKDMLSIPKVFQYLTGKDIDKNSKTFANVDLFQVHDITLVPCDKLVTFSTSTKTKTKFTLIPGTKLTVNHLLFKYVK